MKTRWMLLSLLLLVGSVLSQSPPKNTWADWDFVIGNWPSVQGGGVPGQANAGSFSVFPAMGGKVLMQKGRSEYPAANGRPATVHDDLMIIYPEAGGTKAVYFDNEGHVIHYNVSFSPDKKRVVFLSEKAGGAPQFRLTY
ncbi:MAG TPA: hypothetical protein VJ723_14035, partial [Candidatus Angelobacter sp.]|nr:hypothetical protein [Candidatus Angelobacter sp.]